MSTRGQKLQDSRMVGHKAERRRLVRLLDQGKLPENLLLTGPEGVGKKRLALWLGQLLLCETRQKDQGPCGICASCKQARGLGHPGLQVFGPHKAVGGGSPKQQREAAQGAQADLLARMREDSLYRPPSTGERYYLATVRLIRHETQKRGATDGRRMFLLGDADRLAGQGQQAAANGLLKTLEEPPENTTIVLTAQAPHKLLDTIRSRMVEHRVGWKQEEDIQAILRQDLKEQPSSQQLQKVARRARGRVGRALDLLDPGWQKEYKEARKLLEIAASNNPEKRTQTVQEQDYRGARKEFRERLLRLGEICHEQLVRAVQTQTGEVQKWTQALEAARRAEQEAQQNGNPQLILHRLLTDLEAARTTSSTTTQDVAQPGRRR